MDDLHHGQQPIGQMQVCGVCVPQDRTIDFTEWSLGLEHYLHHGTMMVKCLSHHLQQISTSTYYEWYTIAGRLSVDEDWVQ